MKNRTDIWVSIPLHLWQVFKDIRFSSQLDINSEFREMDAHILYH